MRKTLITKLDPNSMYHDILRKKHGEEGAIKELQRHQKSQIFFDLRTSRALKAYVGDEDDVARVQSRLARARSWAHKG